MLKEFYEQYNLNRTYLAAMAHVGARSIDKYVMGEPVRDITKSRIEKAIRIIKKYDLVRPEYHGCWWGLSCNSYFLEEQKYYKQFDELFNNESDS